MKQYESMFPVAPDMAVKLRWVARPNPIEMGDLVAACWEDPDPSRRAKEVALAHLGISVQPNETPLQAWVDAMCALNGFDRDPYSMAIGDVLVAIGGVDVLDFVLWLA
jgi:hypothetical protein